MIIKYYFKPSSPICATQGFLGKWPPVGSLRSTHQGPHFEKELDLPPCPRGYQLPLTLQQGWKFLLTSLLHAEIFSSSVFHRPCACLHSHKETLCESQHHVHLLLLLALTGFPFPSEVIPALSYYSVSYS